MCVMCVETMHTSHMEGKMNKRSEHALALQSKIFHNKIVKSKKGKGSYSRKNKHKAKKYEN